MNALRSNNDGIDMLAKVILAISFLVVLSATGQAGTTISDKRYWPNEARQSAQDRGDVFRPDPNAAFARDRAGEQFGPATDPTTRWRYQGGPKGR